MSRKRLGGEGREGEREEGGEGEGGGGGEGWAGSAIQVHFHGSQRMKPLMYHRLHFHSLGLAIPRSLSL